MTAKALFLWLALPLFAGACTTSPPPAPALAYWDDVPLPRGFVPVETIAAQAALQVGEFRHGELRYEGPGSVSEATAYLSAKLPLHGWAQDPGSSTWRKGPSVLDVTVSQAPTLTKDGFRKVVVDLRRHSERPPQAPR